MIAADRAPMTHPRAGPWARALAFLAYGLLLLTLPSLGTTALLALVLAYARRDGTAPLVRSHHRFQIRIFWAGLAMGCAALALGTVALWDAARTPPPPVRVPIAPDAQLVAYVYGEDAPAPTPAEVHVFTYSFGPRALVWRTRAALEGGAAAVLFGFACLWGVAAPLYGAARLASGRAMGHDPG